MRSENQLENLTTNRQGNPRFTDSNVEDRHSVEFESWLANELCELETKFAEFVTRNSTLKSFDR